MVIATITNLTKNILNNQKDIFNRICSPAKIEYIIALIAIVSLSVSRLTESSGSTFDDVCSEILPYTIVSSIYIYILNILCKGGASSIAWFIVLSPAIALVVRVMTKTSLLKSELFEEEQEEQFDVVDQMMKSTIVDNNKEDYYDDDEEDDSEDFDEDEDDEDEFYNGEDFEDPAEDEDFKKIWDGK